MIAVPYPTRVPTPWDFGSQRNTPRSVSPSEEMDDLPSVINETTDPVSPTTSAVEQTIEIEIDSASSSVRHERYYITDNEMLVVKVEDELFRIHKMFFKEDSEKIQEELAKDPAKGNSDDTAIVLHKVEIGEFVCLLDFVYLSMRNQSSTLSIDQWKALLSVSTKLRFRSVRNRAISKLTRVVIDPVERIDLAKTYDVPAWFLPAYTDLCQCTELDEDKAERLERREIVKIGKIRERLLGMKAPKDSKDSKDQKDQKDSKGVENHSQARATRGAGAGGGGISRAQVVLSRPTTPVWDESKTDEWTKMTEPPRFDEGIVRTWLASDFKLSL